MKKLWALLAEKGKLATLIGFFFMCPANGKFLYKLFLSIEMNNQELITFMIANAIGMFWFILPSKIKISGPKISIEVED